MGIDKRMFLGRLPARMSMRACARRGREFEIHVECFAPRHPRDDRIQKSYST